MPWSRACCLRARRLGANPRPSDTWRQFDMSNLDRDPILLTPGPLTTSLATKAAMLRDWGSWDSNFNAITARVRERLTRIVNAAESHTCVPLQGSGTFSVEAAVNSLVPRQGHVLVLINGAYGKRLAKLTEMMGRKLTTFETADDVPTTAADVARTWRSGRSGPPRRPPAAWLRGAPRWSNTPGGGVSRRGWSATLRIMNRWSTGWWRGAFAFFSTPRPKLRSSSPPPRPPIRST